MIENMACLHALQYTWGIISKWVNISFAVVDAKNDSPAEKKNKIRENSSSNLQGKYVTYSGYSNVECDSVY